MQYDFVSYGMGFGIYIWTKLGVVPLGICVFLAAEYLFQFYFTVRILFFSRKKEVQARLIGIWCRYINFTCNRTFYATEQDTLRSTDTAWKLYADCSVGRKMDGKIADNVM